MATVLSLFLQTKSILQSAASVNLGRISWYIGNKIIDDYFLVYYFKASENDNIYLKVIYTFERYTDSSVKGWKFKRVVQTWKEEVNETLELE